MGPDGRIIFSSQLSYGTAILGEGFTSLLDLKAHRVLQLFSEEGSQQDRHTWAGPRGGSGWWEGGLDLRDGNFFGIDGGC